MPTGSMRQCSSSAARKRPCEISARFGDSPFLLKVRDQKTSDATSVFLISGLSSGASGEPRPGPGSGSGQRSGDRAGNMRSRSRLLTDTELKPRGFIPHDRNFSRWFVHLEGACWTGSLWKQPTRRSQRGQRVTGDRQPHDRRLIPTRHLRTSGGHSTHGSVDPRTITVGLELCEDQPLKQPQGFLDGRFTQPSASRSPGSMAPPSCDRNSHRSPGSDSKLRRELLKSRPKPTHPR